MVERDRRVLAAAPDMKPSKMRDNLIEYAEQARMSRVLVTLKSDAALPEEATCKEYLQVRQEGARSVSRQLRHYRLEAVLAVGYRVRSPRGTISLCFLTSTSRPSASS